MGLLITGSWALASVIKSLPVAVVCFGLSLPLSLNSSKAGRGFASSLLYPRD